MQENKNGIGINYNSLENTFLLNEWMWAFFIDTHCKNIPVLKSYCLVVVKNLLKQSWFQVKKV